MSQHQHSLSSSDNGGSNRPTQLPGLPPILTINRNTNTSRASRIRARRSVTRVLVPATSRDNLQSAAIAAGSILSPKPATERVARTDSLIRGLISSAQDGADIHRRHGDTARLIATKQNLFQNQLACIDQVRLSHGHSG